MVLIFREYNAMLRIINVKINLRKNARTHIHMYKIYI